jgi:hypothetical protein
MLLLKPRYLPLEYALPTPILLACRDQLTNWSVSPVRYYNFFRLGLTSRISRSEQGEVRDSGFLLQRREKSRT